MDKFKVEIEQDWFIGDINYKGYVFDVEDVVPLFSKSEQEKSYIGFINNQIISIPGYKCGRIYEKENNPEIDDWFNNVIDTQTENEPEPKIYNEIQLIVKKRGFDWSKSITIKADYVTFEILDDLRNKLETVIISKEEERGDFDFNLSWFSEISENKIIFLFGKYGVDDDYGYSITAITKYWKLILKYLNIKEEKPKYEKLKSVKRYGVCRSDSEMLYIEINAKKEIVEEFYNGNISELKNNLEKVGYKCNIYHIDYIIKENVQLIFDTNGNT